MLKRNLFKVNIKIIKQVLILGRAEKNIWVMKEANSVKRRISYY